MKKPERRKKYLVKIGLQFRYLGLILAAVILPVFLISACLYYLVFQLMAEQLAIPESIAFNLMPVFHKINFILIFGVPVIAAALLFLGLSISHRIAGPIFRIEKELAEISKGDFSRRIKLRKRDELASVAGAINRLLDKVEPKLKKHA